MIGAIIPQVQAAAASANIIKNILAGFTPTIGGLEALKIISKDIGGFAFNYIGEERLEAATEITDHYVEDNQFIQDHKAIRPTVFVARGFVADTRFNKNDIFGKILSLSSALATVTPYVGTYSRGTAAKMANAVNQTDQIVNQIAQVAAVTGSVLKFIGIGGQSAEKRAYSALDGLRQQTIPFAVVTPFKIFESMLIENLTMVSPEETRGITDIEVRLKEIRQSQTIAPNVQDNSRAIGLSTPSRNGTVHR